jgi:hypothetical protein
MMVFAILFQVSFCVEATAGSSTASGFTQQEQAFRNTAMRQTANAARRFRLQLASTPAAFAGGEGGLIVNRAILGAERATEDSLKSGIDLLFVYIGAEDAAVPRGYYKVRLIGTDAKFIREDGKTVATFPVTMTDEPTPGAQSRIRLTLSAGWGGGKIFADVEIEFGGTRSAARVIRVTVPRNPRSSK